MNLADAASIKFKNTSKSEVSVSSQKGLMGDEKKLKTIKPGKTAKITTQKGHNLSVRNKKTEELMLEFKLDKT